MVEPFLVCDTCERKHPFSELSDDALKLIASGDVEVRNSFAFNDAGFAIIYARKILEERQAGGSLK